MLIISVLVNLDGYTGLMLIISKLVNSFRCACLMSYYVSVGISL